MVAEEPADGLYRLLMESVESFLATAQVVGEEPPENLAIDQRSGRLYKTISPGAANAAPVWGTAGAHRQLLEMKKEKPQTEGPGAR